MWDVTICSACQVTRALRGISGVESGGLGDWACDVQYLSCVGANNASKHGSEPGGCLDHSDLSSFKQGRNTISPLKAAFSNKFEW